MREKKPFSVAKIWLIVVTILLGLLALASLPMIMMSPMMFDAPGSTENNSLLFAFFSMLAFPVVVVLSLIVSWILFLREKRKAAFLVTLLPFLNILLVVVSLAQAG
jgi:hypothetical protein